MYGQTLADAAVLARDFNGALLFADDLIQQLGQTIHIVRAEGQIDEGIHFAHLLPHALLLHHAAAHADDQIGLERLKLLEPYDVAQRLVFGVFAHAAGVVQHEIGLLAALGRRHAHFVQHSRDGFGIVRVHLAAQRHDAIAHLAIQRVADGADITLLNGHFLIGNDNILSILHNGYSGSFLYVGG